MSDDEADRKLGPRFCGGAVTYPNRDSANADDDPPFVHLSGAAAAPDVTAIPAPPQETGANALNGISQDMGCILLLVGCVLRYAGESRVRARCKLEHHTMPVTARR